MKSWSGLSFCSLLLYLDIGSAFLVHHTAHVASPTRNKLCKNVVSSTVSAEPASLNSSDDTTEESETKSKSINAPGEREDNIAHTHPKPSSAVRRSSDVERGISLLDSALASNTSSASLLLDELRDMGEQGQSRIEEFLNAIIAVIDGDADIPNGDHNLPVMKQLPWWTNIRTFARFSRRARRAALKRVLDISTPTAEENEDSGENVDAAQKRRRRSFVILLRGLASSQGGYARRGRPTIVGMERAARRDVTAAATLEDVAGRLPDGLETPRYEVLARWRRRGYEVRRYDPYSVCTVDMNRSRPSDASSTDAKLQNPQLAGASSFGALAGYLFGKNDRSESMEMTTPVFSRLDDDNRGQEMSFVMPSNFWKDDGIRSAPKPLPESGVKLERESGGHRAVVMFGGFASKKDVEARTNQLLRGLDQDEQWDALEGAPVVLAQYNDPFTPPWKRRNEVSVPVMSA